jgi:glycosyltransferase involved in cell wall biosynthesis
MCAGQSASEGRRRVAAPAEEAGPRICVVVPVFNHGQTVPRVARAARTRFPVIAVDDGSTDETPARLAAESGLVVVTLPRNAGKGAALRAGFARGEELGFTHAITMDADGQHPVGALADFAGACRREPAALVLGVRDLRRAGAPLGRRLSNALSNLAFRLATGAALDDTQCGYRCYPLAAVRGLDVKAGRYAFELELLVRAAWAGWPLVPLAVAVDYAAPTSKRSHFHPLRDLAHIAWVQLRLVLASLGRRGGLAHSRIPPLGLCSGPTGAASRRAAAPPARRPG